MSKISWKGSTLLGPVPPALITCGTLERPNVLTVAWTGIVNTQPPKIGRASCRERVYVLV